MASIILASAVGMVAATVARCHTPGALWSVGHHQRRDVLSTRQQVTYTHNSTMCCCTTRLLCWLHDAPCRPADTGDAIADQAAKLQATKLVEEVWDMFWDDNVPPSGDKARAFR